MISEAFIEMFLQKLKSINASKIVLKFRQNSFTKPFKILFYWQSHVHDLTTLTVQQLFRLYCGGAVSSFESWWRYDYM